MQARQHLGLLSQSSPHLMKAPVTPVPMLKPTKAPSVRSVTRDAQPVAKSPSMAHAHDLRAGPGSPPAPAPPRPAPLPWQRMAGRVCCAAAAANLRGDIADRSSAPDAVAQHASGSDSLHFQDVLKDVANANGTIGLEVDNSLRVTSVALGGPAGIDGTLAVDDKIVAMDGAEARGSEDFRGADMLGSRSTLTIERKGSRMDVGLVRTSATHVGALTMTFNHLNTLRAVAQKGGPKAKDALLSEIDALWTHLRHVEASRLVYEEGLAARIRQRLDQGGLAEQTQEEQSAKQDQAGEQVESKDIPHSQMRQLRHASVRVMHCQFTFDDIELC